MDLTNERKHDRLRAEFREAGRGLVRDSAAARDAGQLFERDLWRQVVDTGLFGLHLPESLGGRGWSIAEIHKTIIWRELQRRYRPGAAARSD